MMETQLSVSANDGQELDKNDSSLEYCRRLKENDATIQCVSSVVPWTMNNATAKLLGTSLLPNTNVQKCSLNVQHLTEIPVALVKWIATSNSLRKLEIRGGDGCEAQVAGALVKAATRNASLTKLSLHTTKLIIWPKAPHLVELTVCDTPMPAAALRVIFPRLSRFQLKRQSNTPSNENDVPSSAHVAKNEMDANAWLRWAAQQPNLMQASLIGDLSLRRDIAESLSGIAFRLQSLSLHQMSISKFLFQGLCNNCTLLEHFELDSCTFDSEVSIVPSDTQWCRLLSSSCSLKTLSLTRCQGLQWSKFLDGIEVNLSLERVVLKHVSGYQGESLCMLFSHPNLKHLSMILPTVGAYLLKMSNNQVYSFWKGLEKLDSKLTNLSLPACGLTGRTMPPGSVLSRMQRLESLCLSLNPLSHVKEFKLPPRLLEVIWNQCQLTDIGLASLLDSLSVCPSLRRVSLKYNAWGPVSAGRLAQVLPALQWTHLEIMMPSMPPSKEPSPPQTFKVVVEDLKEAMRSNFRMQNLQVACSCSLSYLPSSTTKEPLSFQHDELETSLAAFGLRNQSLLVHETSVLPSLIHAVERQGSSDAVWETLRIDPSRWACASGGDSMNSSKA